MKTNVYMRKLDCCTMIIILHTFVIFFLVVFVFEEEKKLAAIHRLNMWTVIKVNHNVKKKKNSLFLAPTYDNFLFPFPLQNIHVHNIRAVVSSRWLLNGEIAAPLMLQMINNCVYGVNSSAGCTKYMLFGAIHRFVKAKWWE